jgi:hypothetical protein
MRVIRRKESNLNGLTTVIVTGDDILQLLKKGHTYTTDNVIIIHEEAQNGSNRDF